MRGSESEDLPATIGPSMPGRALKRIMMHRQLLTFFGFVMFSLKCYGFSKDTSLVLKPVDISASFFSQSKISKSLSATWDKLAIDPIGVWLRGVDIRGISPGASITVNRDGLPSSYSEFMWNGQVFQSPDLGVVDISLIPKYGHDFANEGNGASAVIGSGLGGVVFSSNSNEKSTLDIHSSSIGSFGLGGNWSFKNPKLNQLISIAAGTDSWLHDYSYENYANQRLKRLGAQGSRSEISILRRTIDSNTNSWNEQSITSVTADRGIPEPSTSAYRIGANQADNRFQVNNSNGWHINKYMLELRQSVFSSQQIYSHQTFNILDSNFSKGANVELINKWISSRFLVSNQSQIQVFRVSGENKPDTSASIFSNLTVLKYHLLDNYDLNIYNKISYQYIDFPRGGFSPGVQFLGKSTKANWNIHWKRIFRLPSMNDMFWVPGGNVALLPESGWDLRSSFSFSTQKTIFKIEGFSGRLKNGIIWRPSGLFWQPINENLIMRIGVNFSAQVTRGSDMSQLEIQAMNSVNDKGFPLPYASRGRVRFNYSHKTNWGDFGLNSLAQLGAPTAWTYDRSSDLPFNSFINLYTNVRIAQLNKSCIMSMKIDIQNIFNQQIILQPGYPMPGRYFNLSIQFKS
ncbi:MAG: Vitamin B12 transporter BtuB [Owenweeksia sp. TMED14]|nr:MAG: Vitamin B12 transporter BtuB [Owenweeksia sp. TMED14]